MNDLIKDGSKLVIITLVAGLALGGIYNITKAPIRAQEEKKQQEAYQAVFPDAKDFKEVEGFSTEAASKAIAENENPIDDHENDTINDAVEALDENGQVMGYILDITTSKGYGGDIELTAGIQADGTVNGYSILSIGETAGLGMHAKDTGDGAWANQFKDKKVEDFYVVKDGTGESDDAKIDAISGATVTSKAVTGAMDSGLAYFQSLEKEGGDQ